MKSVQQALLWFTADKYRWLLAVTAIAVGFITSGPALYFRLHNPAYRGIDLLGADNEASYLAQAQEMLDGHYNLGNIYLADHKNDPYVLQPLAGFVMAALAKLLDVSVTDVNLITKTVFPALLTVLAFLFFRDVFRNPACALAATVGVMMAPASYLVLNPAALWTFFTKGQFLYANLNFLAYARPINPQFSFLFFFGYLICLWRFLFIAQTVRQRRLYGLLSSIILGLSFYTYFFAYSYALIWTALMGLWAIGTKRWAEVKGLLAIGLGALVLALPYLSNTLHLIQSPLYGELVGRLGVGYNHTPIFSRVLWGTLVLFTIVARRAPKEIRLWVYTILLAGAIGTNQQLLTGRTVPIPNHYYWFFIQPFATVTLVYLGYYVLERWRTAALIYTASVLVLFFIAGIVFQLQSNQVQLPSFLSEQRYAPLIHTLNHTLPKDATVFANNTISGLLPVYSDLNIYQLEGMGEIGRAHV